MSGQLLRALRRHRQWIDEREGVLKLALGFFQQSRALVGEALGYLHRLCSSRTNGAGRKNLRGWVRVNGAISPARRERSLPKRAS